MMIKKGDNLKKEVILMNDNKTNINWYPGHMTKAIRQMKEDIKLIDLVVEILDARLIVYHDHLRVVHIRHGPGILILTSLNGKTVPDAVDGTGA